MVTQENVPALAAVGTLAVLLVLSLVGWWRWMPYPGPRRLRWRLKRLKRAQERQRRRVERARAGEFYIPPDGSRRSTGILKELAVRLDVDLAPAAGAMSAALAAASSLEVAGTDAPLGAYSRANLTHVSHAVAEAYHGAGVGRWWTSWARSTPARRRTLEEQVLEMWSGQDAEVED